MWTSHMYLETLFLWLKKFDNPEIVLEETDLINLRSDLIVKLIWEND